MSNFAYISGDPDNLTGGAAANMVDIQGPLVDLATWLNTDLQPRVAAAVPTFVTSLPVGATDGQEIYYLADDTNGIVWHLRYRAASASSYKWEFVGGGEMAAVVATTESRSSATYGDLTTVGPSVTVPLAGEYEFEFGAEFFVAAASAVGAVNIQIGATAADEVERAIYQTGAVSAGSTSTPWRKKRRTVSVAATTVKLVYRADGTNNANISNRRLLVRPVRVG